MVAVNTRGRTISHNFPHGRAGFQSRGARDIATSSCHETLTIRKVRRLNSGEAVRSRTPPSCSFGSGKLSPPIYIGPKADTTHLTQASSSSSGNGNQASSSASGGGSSSPVVITTAILSTMISSGANNQQTTIVSSFLTTITQNPQQSGSGNNTNSTNKTTTSSSTRPLSTAPDDATAGGGGPSGAPVPGQSGGGGIYGPDDGYTSSVVGLGANMFLGSLTALVAGGLLVLRW